MIISASVRTDIPAFYGTWFMNRLRAGCCQTVNPFSGQARQVSLRIEDVGGIVFWTKNLRPFLGQLAEVRELGFPFVVHHTINAYPRVLETSVIEASATIDALSAVRDAYGPRAVVWRYDPIVLSTLTPPDFHIRNFTLLAERLRGITDEVVVSFMVPYQKTIRNMNLAANKHGFEWWIPQAGEKHELLRTLAEIAGAHGMQLAICSQPEDLVPGTTIARCIDVRRLSDVAGKELFARLKGNREGCGCYESRDVGDYDSCPHGCIYCYAVRHRKLALERYRKHDPSSEFLFEPAGQRVSQFEQLALLPDRVSARPAIGARKRVASDENLTE